MGDPAPPAGCSRGSRPHCRGGRLRRRRGLGPGRPPPAPGRRRRSRRSVRPGCGRSPVDQRLERRRDPGTWSSGWQVGRDGLAREQLAQQRAELVDVDPSGVEGDAGPRELLPGRFDAGGQTHDAGAGQFRRAGVRAGVRPVQLPHRLGGGERGAARRIQEYRFRPDGPVRGAAGVQARTWRSSWRKMASPTLGAKAPRSARTVFRVRDGAEWESLGTRASSLRASLVNGRRLPASGGRQRPD